MKLKNKVAIVTGAAKGIGQAIAIRMAKEGADVVVVDIDVELLNEVADQIKALERKTLALDVDVSKSEKTSRMAAATLEKFGKIDILVNNAGGPSPVAAFFHESKEDVWDKVISLNLKGVRNCSRAVINHMIDKRSGKIINIASVSGLIGYPTMVDYCAAKAGVIGFTMALAKEVAEYGINVNAISPGVIRTPALDLFISMSPGRGDEVKQLSGLGRMGEPNEIAAVVAFLASEEASYITGQNYPVCGLWNL